MSLGPEQVADAMHSAPALSLGAVIGGTSASSAWEMAIKRLAWRVKNLREGVASPLAVNVVYHIPGEHLSPDFSGVRTGSFSRKTRKLLVQVALPPEPVSDPDAEALALLREAVDVAEGFARQEGIVENRLVELQELLERL
jgi:hypothetical protein